MSKTVSTLGPIADPVILFEDNHLLVVVKPPGMLSQGDTTGDRSLVDWAAAYLKFRHKKRGNAYVGLIHRLDRPVGGVMVLATTSKAAMRLTEQFQNRTIEKTYWAVTEKIPRETSETLTHHLRKKLNINMISAFDEPVEGTKEAVMEYEVLATSGSRALLAVKPLTGRQHQIRVQLARVGCPVVGDGKYGKSGFLPDLSIGLYGHSLGFKHPVSKAALLFEALPPDQNPWNLFPEFLNQEGEIGN